MALTSTRLIDEISLRLTVLDGRDFDHGHHFTKHPFRAKVVVDGKEFVTKPSAKGIWNEDFTITIKAESHIRLEVICKHKKAQDDHTIGVNDNRGVLGTISKPNVGVIEVSLSRPGREKAAGLVRYTIDVIKTHELRRGTHHQASLSWRTLNNTDIIRKVVFNDDMDDLVPPQWACIISSLDGLVENTKDLAELNSSAKIAVGAVCAAIKLIIEQVERDERVEALTETMSTIYYHIQDTNFDKIKSFEETLQRLVKMTTECAYFIASYKQKAFARRTIEGAILGVDGIIKDFEEEFAQLRIEFLMGSTLQSTHTVLLVLNKVRNIETLLHLQHLPLIQNAIWKRVRTELAPEQEQVLDGLTIWAQNSDERVVSLLVGDSRDEASLIAHKLCERFHNQRRLGSAIFFPESTRTGSTELSCQCLVSTIARDLAALHPAFAESIAEALASSPRLAHSSDVDDFDRQFEDLLVHPLQSLAVVGPVLIVIDCLDRCSDHLKFVEALGSSQVLKNIPRNIRFLLIVGPQSELLYPLIHLTNSSLRLWHVGGDTKSVVFLYWFWRHISEGSQEQLFNRVEEVKAAMTPIYSCAGFPRPTITPTLLLFEIRQVVAKRGHAPFLEPLLDQARQSIPPELMARFESYVCFVSIQASHWNRPFNVLFLELKGAMGPELSSRIQKISDTHHLKEIPPDILKWLPQESSDYPKALPFLVLRYLNMALMPNVCRFEEITKLNKDIKDLDDRLKIHVPTTLRLLSGCWSEWVAPCLQTLHEGYHRAALSELRTFLSSHLLSWIELISLLECADAGLKQLQLLELVLSQMMKGTSADIEDIKFIHNAISDSIRFMFYFRTSIWIGGLFVHRLAFFAPTNTFIHQTYAPKHVVKSGLTTDWPYKFSIMSVDYPRAFVVNKASNNAVLTSLHRPWTNTHGSIKLWNLEAGAHLRTFEVPDIAIPSYTDGLKFLASPSQSHFAFIDRHRVSFFKLDCSNNLKQFEFEGHACSICYTPDETSLAIRVQEGHLYFMDLATSEIHTYPSLFPRQQIQQSILEISPNNGHVGTISSHNSAAVEVYDLAYGQARAVKTLKHIRSEAFSIKQIIWSKDQSHIITIIKQTYDGFCCLWDVETLNCRQLGIGRYGSADFGDNGLIILAREREICLVNCSTFEVVTVIPLSVPNQSSTIFGHHGLVMTCHTGVFFFHDISVKTKSSHSSSMSSPLPQVYQEKGFQNSVKHKLRVQDLELVDGWLVMKPDIKLVWIPPPFTRLRKDESVDQITISDFFNDVSLVLDCKVVEKYLL